LNCLHQLVRFNLRTFAGLPAFYTRLLEDESGQDMIEYVLLAALLSLSAITVVNGLGAKISSAYSSIATNLTSNT
jgi:pilus assembly protein Flp/PilA